GPGWAPGRAPEDEMLRRRARADRVELEEAEPPHGVEHGRRRAVEELRADRNAAGFVGRDEPHRCTVSSPAAARSLSSARSKASSSAPDRRMPSSRWKAFTNSAPPSRADFGSAR